MGARGKGEYGHGVTILRRPPAAFWLLCRRGQSNPPSADGGIPLQKEPYRRGGETPQKTIQMVLL